DAGIGLTWRLKDDLPAERHVYYGKILRGRPCLVALDLFPAFYALIRGHQRARDYRMEYDAGRLTFNAKRIMDALTTGPPPYIRAAVYTRASVLRRLFALDDGEAQDVVRRLITRRVVVDTDVTGWPGRWLVHTAVK